MLGLCYARRPARPSTLQLDQTRIERITTFRLLAFAAKRNWKMLFIENHLTGPINTFGLPHVLPLPPKRDSKHETTADRINPKLTQRLVWRLAVLGDTRDLPDGALTTKYSAL